MGYNIFFDGCCEPKNPGGSMGLGVVVLDTATDQVVHEISYGCIVGQNWHEPTSNNIAEYLAFLSALKWLSKQDTCMVNFFGDSKLVVEQMNGSWGIKEGMYRQYALRAKEELRQLWREKGTDHSIFWIPREENEAADKLSKAALTSKGIKITDRTKK
jgi:ribonuclease HI